MSNELSVAREPFADVATAPSEVSVKLSSVPS
jgi:hypothetical protein